MVIIMTKIFFNFKFYILSIKRNILSIFFILYSSPSIASTKVITDPPQNK